LTVQRCSAVSALGFALLISSSALAATQTRPAHPRPAPAAKSAAPAGDPANGQKRFRSVCEVCHLASRTATPNDLLTKVGPNLSGVVGRKAGTYPRFRYSSAMKKSGLVWTRENLKAYTMNPQKMIPNVRMSFGGLKNPKDADDIIAWLATQ
jgi:cytochrome c